MSSTSILGIALEEDGRVRLWIWSPATSLQILGIFTPGSAMGVAMRLMRDRPDLEIFAAQEAAVLLADMVGSIR